MTNVPTSFTQYTGGSKFLSCSTFFTVLCLILNKCIIKPFLSNTFPLVLIALCLFSWISIDLVISFIDYLLRSSNIKGWSRLFWAWLVLCCVGMCKCCWTQPLCPLPLQIFQLTGIWFCRVLILLRTWWFIWANREGPAMALGRRKTLQRCHYPFNASKPWLKFSRIVCQRYKGDW